MEQFYDKVSASAAYIRAHIPQAPTVGIILGSGLGGLVDRWRRRFRGGFTTTRASA